MKFNKLYNLIEGVFEPASPEERSLRRKEMHPNAIDFSSLNYGDKIIYHIPADGMYFKDPNESEGPYSGVVTIPNNDIRSMENGTERWLSQIEIIKSGRWTSRVVLNRHLTKVNP